MSGHPVLVTGANGFIGSRLVSRLIDNGNRVRCLVRSPKKGEELVRLGCELAFGDITNPGSFVDVMDGVREVYHVAGQTRDRAGNDMMTVNRDGTRNLLEACCHLRTPPRFVYVSSLAAAGPGKSNEMRCETDPAEPVSKYGKSKLAAENIAREFASKLPTSIVRPPVVFGGGDKNCFQMFDAISRFGIHFVSGPKNAKFSFIHVDDLVESFIEITKSGQCLDATQPDKGVYFVAAEQHPTFAEFGEMIGKSLGKNVRIIRARRFGIAMVAAVNEVIAKLTGKASYLNWDKSREAVAGPWWCSGEKLGRETGFRPKRNLQQRVDQTAAWFFDHGWLKTAPLHKQHQQDPLTPSPM